MKLILGLVVLVILIVGSLENVVAHGEETFAAAEDIIKQKVPCDELSEDQLEILGDYYMEQMHPGEAHEIMDERMGGEGSESLREMHINMGKVFYCGEHGAMSGGMMDMMMGRGMMGSGNIGMMRNYNNAELSSLGIFGLLFSVLIIVLLVLLIIWLIKQLQRSDKRKRR